jgi:2-haloacid dehalogenase
VPSVDKALKPKLLDAYLTLDAYADARAALQELKSKGRKAGILSNGTPHMLKMAVEAARLGADLERVLSVDSIRMYKPRPEVYKLVTDAFDVAPAEVMFVSSNRWDVMGATAFGFHATWINRGGMPDEYADLSPMRVLPDLHELVARS